VKIQVKDIYVFSATYSCTAALYDDLRVNKLLEISDDKHDAKNSRLLLYIQEMLIIILYNICILLKLVNDVRDMAAEIVFDIKDILFKLLKLFIVITLLQSDFFTLISNMFSAVIC